MRQVSLSEILLLLGFCFLVYCGGFLHGSYNERGKLSLPDTSAPVITYVPQVPTSGTAKPMKRRVQIIRDTVRIEQPRPLNADSVTIAYSEYDSLRLVRYWEIQGENIGLMELAFDPISEVLSYSHTPPPLKIQTVEIIREREPRLTDKLEWAGYGAAGAAVLILLLR